MNDDKLKVSKKSWRGSWDRPVKIDEESYDPLTVARMSDHNVRGNDQSNESIKVNQDSNNLKRGPL